MSSNNSPQATIALAQPASAPRSATADRARRLAVVLVLAHVAALTPARHASAQSAVATTASPGTSASDAAADSRLLDSLVLAALATHPTITAAAARARAARHRLTAAGAPPDPMLMAGIQNLPLGRETMPSSSGAMATTGGAPSGPDPMTMRMVGVSQTIPYPGKLRLRTRIAAREVGAADAALEVARRQVARDVKDAYYELAFLDRAYAIVTRNRDVLAGIIRVTDARYGVGTAGQQDVLEPRIDAIRLAESASGLIEQRRAALARLNALLARPSEVPVAGPVIPDRIVRLAVASGAGTLRFASDVLGARAAGSPFPPLIELQESALAGNAELREHESMIAAQSERTALAGRERLPDVGVSLQYGQRGGGLPDMMSATITLPLPIFGRRKQDQFTADAAAQLEALHAEHRATSHAIRADVARLVSELERERTQLALYTSAILPQGRAALASATGGLEVGRTGLLAVLDAHTSLLGYETAYVRTLADFARHLAELERLTGAEVGP